MGPFTIYEDFWLVKFVEETEKGFDLSEVISYLSKSY
jgi:hypothetical protein